MCDCEKKNAERIENALIALDGAISTLVMARIILEQGEPQQAAQPLPEPVADIAPDAVPRDVPAGACEHRNCIDIQTMGAMAQLCSDCGEQV